MRGLLCSDGAEALSPGEHDWRDGRPFSQSHMNQAPTTAGSVPNAGDKVTPRTDQVSVPGEGEKQ